MTPKHWLIATATTVASLAAVPANAFVFYAPSGPLNNGGFSVERNGKHYSCRVVERDKDIQTWSCRDTRYWMDTQDGRYKPVPEIRCRTVRRSYLAMIYCSDGTSIDISQEPDRSGEDR